MPPHLFLNVADGQFFPSNPSLLGKFMFCIISFASKDSIVTEGEEEKKEG